MSTSAGPIFSQCSAGDVRADPAARGPKPLTASLIVGAARLEPEERLLASNFERIASSAFDRAVADEQERETHRRADVAGVIVSRYGSEMTIGRRRRPSSTSFTSRPTTQPWR